MSTPSNIKSVREWLDQSSYDYETARAMFKTARYIYTVFMCHLAVEKALKGLLLQAQKKDPPKTHHLLYLKEQTGIDFPDTHVAFLRLLNDVSVPTRYPDQLRAMLKQFNRKNARDVIAKTQELLSWLKKQSLK
jgi:HEPN domain-containing protein